VRAQRLSRWEFLVKVQASGGWLRGWREDLRNARLGIERSIASGSVAGDEPARMTPADAVLDGW